MPDTTGRHAKTPYDGDPVTRSCLSCKARPGWVLSGGVFLQQCDHPPRHRLNLVCLLDGLPVVWAGAWVHQRDGITQGFPVPALWWLQGGYKIGRRINALPY